MKYYIIRALSENLKQFSLILTNIYMFETMYVLRFKCDVKNDANLFCNHSAGLYSFVDYYVLTKKKSSNIMFSHVL